MARIHINTHAERQQLTGNLIKPALMKSLFPKRREEERRDERRSKGGQGRED